MFITVDIVREALKEVIDPEIKFSIIDLGIVYRISIENAGKKVIVRMTLTSPTCPYGSVLVSQVEQTLKMLPGVTDVEVKLVWQPQWNPKTMASDDVKDKMEIW
jgi:metal-sulfur cluster biosynthetic enzyme